MEDRTAIERFESAIREFGVDNTLDYFEVDGEKRKDYVHLRLKEKILKTSNIYKINWNETNLIVVFNNGNIYQYFDVPERLSISMGEADSPGSFFNREIKGNYRYSRIA
jgi:hypothetical protein